MIKFIVFLVSLACCSSLKPPPYIKPCPKGPEFSKCAIESAKYAIPELAKGDKTFKIPNMSPLMIPLVHLSSGDVLDLKITNLRIYGLETTEPVEFNFDFETNTGMTLTRTDKLVLLGDYEINGKISVIPVEGRGPLNITLIDAEYSYTFSWTLTNKNGVEYIDTVDGNFDYKLGRAHYKLDNLFNGNKLLGDQVNVFLNENWLEVSVEFKKTITHTMELIYEQISRKLYTKVPYHELFL